MDGRRRGDIRQARARLSARERTRGAGREHDRARTRKDRTTRRLRGEEPNLEEVRITSSGREEALEHWWTRETRISSSNNRVVRTENALGAEVKLAARARQVLRQNDKGFRRRSYWRGPTWPVVNWLFWWSLLRAGQSERAQRLRQASLHQPSPWPSTPYR